MRKGYVSELFSGIRSFFLRLNNFGFSYFPVVSLSLSLLIVWKTLVVPQNLSLSMYLGTGLSVSIFSIFSIAAVYFIGSSVKRITKSIEQSFRSAILELEKSKILPVVFLSTCFAFIYFLVHYHLNFKQDYLTSSWHAIALECLAMVCFSVILSLFSLFFMASFQWLISKFSVILISYSNSLESIEYASSILSFCIDLTSLFCSFIISKSSDFNFVKKYSLFCGFYHMLVHQSDLGYLITFSLLIPIFYSRILNSIFTKTADISCDVFGKLKFNTTESDAKNPFSIYDMLGDIVGDMFNVFTTKLFFLITLFTFFNSKSNLCSNVLFRLLGSLKLDFMFSEFFKAGNLSGYLFSYLLMCTVAKPIIILLTGTRDYQIFSAIYSTIASFLLYLSCSRVYVEKDIKGILRIFGKALLLHGIGSYVFYKVQEWIHNKLEKMVLDSIVTQSFIYLAINAIFFYALHIAYLVFSFRPNHEFSLISILGMNTCTLLQNYDGSSTAALKAGLEDSMFSVYERISDVSLTQSEELRCNEIDTKNNFLAVFHKQFVIVLVSMLLWELERNSSMLQESDRFSALNAFSSIVQLIIKGIISYLPVPVTWINKLEHFPDFQGYILLSLKTVLLSYVVYKAFSKTINSVEDFWKNLSFSKIPLCIVLLIELLQLNIADGLATTTLLLNLSITAQFSNIVGGFVDNVKKLYERKILKHEAGASKQAGIYKVIVNMDLVGDILKDVSFNIIATLLFIRLIDGVVTLTL